MKRHVEQLSRSRTSGDSTESMSLRDEMKNGNCSNYKGKNEPKSGQDTSLTGIRVLLIHWRSFYGSILPHCFRIWGNPSRNWQIKAAQVCLKLPFKSNIAKQISPPLNLLIILCVCAFIFSVYRFIVVYTL